MAEDHDVPVSIVQVLKAQGQQLPILLLLQGRRDDGRDRDIMHGLIEYHFTASPLPGEMPGNTTFSKPEQPCSKRDAFEPKSPEPIHSLEKRLGQQVLGDVPVPHRMLDIIQQGLVVFLVEKAKIFVIEAGQEAPLLFDIQFVLFCLLIMF